MKEKDADAVRVPFHSLIPRRGIFSLPMYYWWTRLVSGVARPGEVLALMGASGAGKTTLLNALTMRNTMRGVNVEGAVYENGRSVGPRRLAAVSGYVQQQDLFIGTLTVREILTFQARTISRKCRQLTSFRSPAAAVRRHLLNIILVTRPSFTLSLPLSSLFMSFPFTFLPAFACAGLVEDRQIHEQ
jgi:ABC-type multidrug transport system fused ATPase/permease subunit